MKLNKLKRFIKRFILRQKKQENKNIFLSDESVLIKENNVKIQNSNIWLQGKSKLIIHDNVSIDNYDFYLKDAYLEIGENSIFNKGRNPINSYISIQTGTLKIGKNNIIRSDFLIRFNGICEIGNYNGICEETEIRCDDKVTFGDFNMISYQCMFYDTNTHCIYPAEFRRDKTRNEFPNIGLETEKPNTKPLVIGSDCWIGKRAVILKGSVIENECIIGTNAVISNKHIPQKATVVGNPAQIKFK